MSSERKLTCELYLEGQRFPFNGISVTVRPNMPATAQIVLPPISNLVDIPPRTSVHVFYEENFSKGKKPKDNMRLLFEGEVMGHSFTKTPAGRSFVIHCEDLTGYYKYIYFYLFTDLQNIVSLTSVTGFNILNFSGAGEAEGTKAEFNLGARGTVLDDLLSENQIPSVFIKIIEEAINRSPVYQDDAIRTKMLDKIASLEDTDIEKIYKARETLKIMQGQIASSLPAYAELNKILEHTMALTYYMFVNNPAASINTAAKSGLGSTIFKPLTFFTAPPTCNVIFPSQYSNLSFQRYFMSEPTRLHMTVKSIVGGRGSEFLDRIYVAPFDLAKRFVNRKQNTAGPLLENNDSDILRETFLDEITAPDIHAPSREDIKGILPTFYQFGNAELIRAFIDQRTDTRFEDMDRAFSDLAEYELLKQQHSPRSASVSCIFSPQLVCGFPAVVLDREALVFGEISSLSHTISADGSASSNFILGYARNGDPVGGDGKPAVLPPFINSKFIENEDGSIDAYPELLGPEVRSIRHDIINPATGFTAVPDTQAEAASFLLDFYEGSDNKDQLVQNETFRRVASKSETFAAIGAVEVNENEWRNASAQPTVIDTMFIGPTLDNLPPITQVGRGENATIPFRQPILDVIVPLARELRKKRAFNIT